MDKLRPLRREGDRENRWVLLDYGDVVVHVQHSEERELYALERLWRDCPVIDLELPDDQQHEKMPAPGVDVYFAAIAPLARRNSPTVTAF